MVALQIACSLLIVYEVINGRVTAADWTLA